MASWLRDLRKIQDVIGHDPIIDWAATDADRKAERATEKWVEKLRKPIPLEPSAARWFGSCLHDSLVISVQRRDDALEISLNHVDAVAFSSVVASHLGVEEAPGPWPISFCFEGVDCARWVRYDLDRNLRHSEPPDSSDPPSSLLYDWFEPNGERLAWFGCFWTNQPSSHRLSSEVYALIDCRCARTSDQIGRQMEAAYGPQARALWESLAALPGSLQARGPMAELLRDRMSELDGADRR